MQTSTFTTTKILILICLYSPRYASSSILDNHLDSPASEGQLKYAEEQKYDQTGPGAEGPESAYKTYNRLEDALLGYLDDPDTKLPETERLKAYSTFGRPSGFDLHDFSSLHKPLDDTFGFRNWGLLRRPFLNHNFEQVHGIRGNPTYTYSNKVHDHKSGDRKRQQEFRAGDGSVTGYYTVLDPDGSERTVRYTADDNNGFKATVHRSPVVTIP